ncbi:MAG: T9SS type A sorting domain-containing protein [Saprospiraceae bacterium]
MPVWWAKLLYGYFTNSNLEFQECSSSFEGGLVSLKNQNVGISLFPNPTNGIAQLRFSSYDKAKSYKAVVLDGLGKRLSVHAIDFGKCEMDLSGLPSGLYFIQVLVDENLLKTKKLVKY